MTTKNSMFVCRLITIILAMALPTQAADVPYQLPPKKIADVINAPMAPIGFLNPQGSVILLATPVIYPPIADLAKPMLRLAGYRIDPTTNGPHHPIYWKKLVFKPVDGTKEIPVRLPADAKPGKFAWNAAGTRVAFQNTTDNGIELWIAEADTGETTRFSGFALVDVLWRVPFVWTPDQRLLATVVPSGRGAPPAPPAAPSGPTIQEASATEKSNSTYEARDVLQNEFDARLFDYYATAQLALVDPGSGALTPVGKPAIFSRASVSPDGRYILVSRLHRPYSYSVTAARFPEDVDVWTIDGKPVHGVARLPLADQVPIRGVRTGPQDVSWWPTDDATLTWTEALDGGDWKTKVPFRTQIKRIRAPFKGKPEDLFKTELRTGGLLAMQSGTRAWVWTSDEDRHWTQHLLADLGQSPPRLKVLWEGSWDETYADPGNPEIVVLANNKIAVREHDGTAFLSGEGGTPEGYRPFLDRLDLATGEKVRLFRCDREHYEVFEGWTDVERGLFLTRREAPTEPPNFFLRTVGDAPKAAVPEGEAARESTMRAVTAFADPVPILRKITKRLITYKRADGVELSFTLLLPPEYKKGTRYPTVLHAYPLDYTDGAVAGQVRDSDKTFTTVWGPDELLYALAGYVVLYNTAIPIVGPSMAAYDNYTEQLVASAKAAIDKAVELGVTDPDRVGVIGHSHGAMMTANLLARSTLFRAGVARSGAYNKTLTMFGFQSERRTLWEGQKTYLDVSPLFFADKIKAPLLLIHGDLDPNPGTTPMQSERMFEAIRGLGGTARLVMLPFEAHGYQSLESVQHVLYEMVSWFDRYVKGKK
jgi:dipeptidyl aminopeptidase/acylaminoacyl peptidase